MGMLKGAVSLISVVAGVMAGYHCGTVWAAIAVMLVAIGVRGSAARIMRRNLGKLKIATRLHSVWPCLLLIGLAMFSVDITRPSGEELPLGEPCILSGVVKESATTTMGGRYLVRLKGLRRGTDDMIECSDINVMLFTSALHALQPGDEIRWESVLLPVEETRPKGVRYHTYDMVRIYDGTVHKKSGKARYTLRDGHLEVTGRSHSLQAMAWRWRNRIAILLETSGLDDESARLLRTLLTGERSGIRPDRRELFRDAGVSHTLAVSGMHVGIIAGLLVWLTLPLNILPRGGRWRMIIVLGGVWLFTVFTGMMYSTLRSALMITLSGAGRMLGRKASAFNGVCMAGVLILLFTPEALWDVGFQLSFLCVGGLTLFMEPLNPVNMRSHKTLHSLVSVLLATLVATGTTWPVTARYFGELPLNFVYCNMIMVPMLPVLMIAGLLQTALASCGVNIEWFTSLIDWLVEKLYVILSHGGENVIDISPSAISVSLWMVAIALLGLALHRHRVTPKWHPGAIVARSADALSPVCKIPLWISVALFVASICTL